VSPTNSRCRSNINPTLHIGFHLKGSDFFPRKRLDHTEYRQPIDMYCESLLEINVTAIRSYIERSKSKDS